MQRKYHKQRKRVSPRYSRFLSPYLPTWVLIRSSIAASRPRFDSAGAPGWASGAASLERQGCGQGENEDAMLHLKLTRKDVQVMNNTSYAFQDPFTTSFLSPTPHPQESTRKSMTTTNLHQENNRAGAPLSGSSRPVCTDSRYSNRKLTCVFRPRRHLRIPRASMAEIAMTSTANQRVFSLGLRRRVTGSSLESSRHLLTCIRSTGKASKTLSGMI